MMRFVECSDVGILQPEMLGAGEDPVRVVQLDVRVSERVVGGGRHERQ